MPQPAFKRYPFQSLAGRVLHPARDFLSRWSGLVVYEWNAWGRYLIRGSKPLCQRLEAFPQDCAADVLRRLPRNTTHFLFHCNLTDPTLWPADRDALVQGLEARGIVVLNGHTPSLRRRNVQRLLREAGLPDVAAPREGDPAELLIAKSDHNYAGANERKLLALAPGFACGEPSPLFQSSEDYRVLRRAEVPAAWWDDERVAIERFVDNQPGWISRAYLLGDRFVLSRALIPGPVKKIAEARERCVYRLQQGQPLRRHLGAVPPSEVEGHVATALAVATALRLHCVCLDIVEEDSGACFAIDVNPTPRRSLLRFGVQAWLRGARLPCAPGAGRRA